MRILCITNPKSGVAYHRLLMPLIYMMKQAPNDYLKITNQLTEEDLEQKWDLLLMNRSFSFPAKKLEEWKNKYNFKLIVDNDDHWILDPYHILYDHYRSSNIPKQITSYIEIADACTVTHERLANEVYQYNQDIYILPNALPYGDGQFTSEKQPSDKIRLFWSGSDTHAQDICLLRNPMKRIYSDMNKQLSVVMAGYSERSKPVWDTMISAFTFGLKFDTQIYNFVDPEKYMFPYCDSDISLIPLLNSPFNSMKSNLKVLETAAKKNPAVVSMTDPYMDLPVCYVPTQQHWYKWIKELTNDSQMRKEMGEQLFNHCNKHFNLLTINKTRYELYSSIVNNLS